MRATVHLGLWITLSALSLVAVYPFLPGHQPIVAVPYLAMFSSAAAVALVVSLLPEHVFHGPRCYQFVFACALLAVGFTSASVAISGGSASPLYLLYPLTLIVVTTRYPKRPQAVVTLATLAGYLGAIIASGGPIDASQLLVRLAMLALITALASIIAADKDRSGREAMRRAELLATVAAVARDVSGKAAKEVLAHVAEAMEALGFELSHVSVVDDRTGHFEVLEARGLPKRLVATWMSRGSGLIGPIRDCRATVELDDYAADPHAAPELVELGVKSAIGSPLFVDGEFVGVLVGGSTVQRTMSVQDVEAFDLLGTIASRALEAAKRYRDVKDNAARMRRMALHDELTGLPNRSMLHARLEALLQRPVPNGRPSLLLIDLDDFKRVNDTLGHLVGDELLVAIADRLVRCADPRDLVVRLSGDEFAILVPDEVPGKLDRLTAAVLAALAQPVKLERHFLTVTASIGVATIRLDNSTHEERVGDAERLLVDADVAMYEAKRAGKACAVVFDEAMRRWLEERMVIEGDITDAISSGELGVVYQPIIDLDRGRVSAFEALARWRHPVLGDLSPTQFVPIAEACGAILPIGRFVLGEACAELARLRSLGERYEDLRISVNLSPRQLRQAGLIEEIVGVLARTGVPPAQLMLEITESALMEDAESAGAKLRSLAALGIRVALDDFGTGYSSLAYLQEFQVHAVKIDRSFVARLDGGGAAPALVHSMVELSAALGLHTVAEGIETLSQLVQLERLGCDKGQGFLLSRPIAGGQLREFVDGYRHPVATQASDNITPLGRAARRD